MKNQLEEAKSLLGEGPSATTRARQRARFLSGADGHSSWGRWWIPAVAIAGVSLLSWWGLAGRHRTPSETATSGMTFASTTTPSLHFADGSTLELSSGATARADTIDAQRVEFVLERGTLDAEITKGTGRTWRFHAGAWVVRVVGTHLRIVHRPESAQLEVSVNEGVVEVTGPGGTAMVRAGETLSRTEPQPPVPALLPPPPEPSPAPSPSPVSPIKLRAASPPTMPSVVEVAREEPPTERLPEWKRLLSDGQRSAALVAAEREGWLQAKSSLSPVDALVLADAARVERKAAVARTLLHRFDDQHDETATEAAFLLGRLEADEHRLVEASTAFGRALALSPDGPFAEQARGRRLEVLLEASAMDEAVEAAKDSLAHHPQGAWSNLARRVVAKGNP